VSTIITIVAGIVIIMTGAVAAIRWLVKLFQTRRVARANELAEKESERQRLALRRKTRIFSPVGIRIPSADAWIGTTASGYGSTVRDDLRRKGLTPADYARGATHRKLK
jgi:flagellar basal body-associated protein FliL